MSEDPELTLVRQEFERAKAEAARRLVELIDILTDCDQRGRGRGLGAFIARARARNLRRLLMQAGALGAAVPRGPWGLRL